MKKLWDWKDLMYSALTSINQESPVPAQFVFHVTGFCIPDNRRSIIACSYNSCTVKIKLCTIYLTLVSVQSAFESPGSRIPHPYSVVALCSSDNETSISIKSDRVYR